MECVKEWEDVGSFTSHIYMLKAELRFSFIWNNFFKLWTDAVLLRWFSCIRDAVVKFECLR